MGEADDRASVGLRGILTEDPLAEMKRGDAISFRNVGPLTLSGGTARAQAATNWQAFEGALLAIVIKEGNQETIVGSAAVVAPGLAVTATHNVRDSIEAMMAGNVVPVCAGLRSDGLELWTIRHMTISDNNDLTLLSLVGASSIPPDATYWKFAMTTRTPTEGEELMVLGFAEDRAQRRKNGEFFGAVYGVRGTVVHVYHRRDNVLMPFPTIEIACGSRGGMSGGPVLDKNGHLVGVVSRGLDTEDGLGPTFVSWIIDAFHRKVPLEWPKGLHKTATSLIDVDDRLATIVGRHAIEFVDGQPAFRIWFA